MDNITDINNYVNTLLQDKKVLKKEYRLFVTNTYGIDRVGGIISAELLNKVIRKARKRKIWRQMLVDILLYADKDSMTNENFSLLLRFNKQVRANYLSSLAHSALSFYQMQVINEYSPQSYEAFAYLFDHMCHYDIFTIYDIENLISKSSITKLGLQYCIKYAVEKYGKLDKIVLATEICEKMEISDIA